MGRTKGSWRTIGIDTVGRAIEEEAPHERRGRGDSGGN